MNNQQLNVTLSIPIPEDMILIKKVELEELKKESLKGVFWTMKDLEKKTGRQAAWIKENILYKTSFKQKLSTQNGGFVYYPRSQGEKWSFLASKMSQFLEENFHVIFS